MTNDETRMLKRFRHMMVESMVCKVNITDDELLCKLKGESQQEKFRNLECVLAMTSDEYWEYIGL